MCIDLNVKFADHIFVVSLKNVLLYVNIACALYVIDFTCLSQTIPVTNVYTSTKGLSTITNKTCLKLSLLAGVGTLPGGVILWYAIRYVDDQLQFT